MLKQVTFYKFFQSSTKFDNRTFIELYRTLKILKIWWKSWKSWKSAEILNWGLPVALWVNQPPKTQSSLRSCAQVWEVGPNHGATAASQILQVTNRSPDLFLLVGNVARWSNLRQMNRKLLGLGHKRSIVSDIPKSGAINGFRALPVCMRIHIYVYTCICCFLFTGTWLHRYAIGSPHCIHGNKQIACAWRRLRRRQKSHAIQAST